MNIIYRAFDGTEFDDEIVCQHYEAEKQNETMNDSIIGMDVKEKIIKYTDCDFLNNARYIYIKDHTGIDAIRKRCYNEGITLDDYFDEPGVYFWNDIDIPNLESDTWQSVDFAIATLNDIINEMVTISNKLMNQLN